MTRVPTTLRTAALLVLLLLMSLSGSPAARAGVGPDPVGEWPLRPVPSLVAGFDPPTDPWGPGHRGVDLLGSPGQPVHAALAGRVTFAGSLAGRGVVVVGHGPTRTTYEPVTSFVVVGDRVAAGAVLGRLDLPGSHCHPRSCLHWGWIRGETYLDPLDLVGAGPVRLLPLWRDLPLDEVAPGAAVRTAPLHPWAGWRPPASVLVDARAELRRADVPAGRPVGGGPW